LEIAALLEPEFPENPRRQWRDRICFGVDLELRQWGLPCERLPLAGWSPLALAEVKLTLTLGTGRRNKQDAGGYTQYLVVLRATAISIAVL
jgi:hypothetical protein